MDCNYNSLTKDQLFEKLVKLNSIYLDFIKKSGYNVADIHPNIDLLEKLIIRVDKRKTYYKIFHKDLKLNAPKRAALCVYWLLRFKPFSYLPNRENESVDINISFAMFYIFSSINQDYKKRGLTFIEPSEDYIKTLKYAFKYWDLSKEAVMLLSETLGVSLLHDGN